MTADGVCRVGHYCRVLVATGAVIEHDDVVPVALGSQQDRVVAHVVVVALHNNGAVRVPQHVVVHARVPT